MMIFRAPSAEIQEGAALQLGFRSLPAAIRHRNRVTGPASRRTMPASSRRASLATAGQNFPKHLKHTHNYLSKPLGVNGPPHRK
jgi:hypothetical protein